MLHRALLTFVAVLGLVSVGSQTAFAHGPYGGGYYGQGYGYGGYRPHVYQAPPSYYITQPYGYGSPRYSNGYYRSPGYGYGGYSGYNYGGYPYSGYPYRGGIGYGRPGFSLYLSR